MHECVCACMCVHVCVCLCALQISHFYFLFDGLCAHPSFFPYLVWVFSLFSSYSSFFDGLCVSVKYGIVLEISVAMYQGHQSCRDVAWR